MFCCCDHSQEIGCFTHCEVINTKLIAPAQGTYIVELEVNGTPQIIEVYIPTASTVITFPSETINERSSVIFKVKSPGGTYLKNISGDECFSFKMKL